ncbi:MAG: ferrochelatase [Desulfobulbaceae bacterium]|nr:ferrochelatase [Desulfobulbaceae bacterium]
MTGGSKGVILLNMGGPDCLDNVRPFLFNLFSDREIIKLGPPFLQKYIAWYIARKRAPKSRAIYAGIGGGSPLENITRAQAKALELSLAKHGEYHVTIAMRYWPPYPEHALTELDAKGVNDITALSLYPHYSRATTGSSIKQLQKSISNFPGDFKANFISFWPTQQSYIQALGENILEAIETFGAESVQVVYSAHSLPTSFIMEGDPYVEHLNQTIKEVEKLTGYKGLLCYQSRSGPVEWLSPSTPETLDRLASNGCKNVVMVPLSFVSDHVETLYEIDILYKNRAQNLGMTLRSSNSLNTKNKFIEGLRDLVLEQRDFVV